jgi:hypothetical protein
MGSAASRHRGPAAHLAQAAFFGALCGAGKPLDIGRYFHVIPTLSALDTQANHRKDYTLISHYGYKDQVRAQQLQSPPCETNRFGAPRAPVGDA